MWTEEKIRAVLESREEALTNAEVQLKTAEAWLQSGLSMKAADFVSAAYKDVQKYEPLVLRLKEQVKVLSAILDIKK